MKHDTLIAIVDIRLEAPLSIAMPVAKATQPNKWQNFPVMPIGYDEEGQPELSGFLPATTVRGALRRFAVLPEMEAAAAGGNPYKLQQAYTELIGQDASSEKQPDEIDLVEIKAAREASPIVDLFGSGLGVKSRLMVSNFVPSHPVLPVAFTAVRKDLGDIDGIMDALTEADRDEYLTRERANRRRAQAEDLVDKLKREERAALKKGEDDTELKTKREEAEKVVSRCREEMGEMQVSTRSLMTSYALPGGLNLKGKFVVRNARDRDLDILLKGLDGLSRWPVLGAQSARGCGEISGRAEFKRNDHLFKHVSFGGFKPADSRDL